MFNRPTEAEVRALMADFDNDGRRTRMFSPNDQRAVVAVCEDWLRRNIFDTKRPDCVGQWWVKTPEDRPEIIEVFDRLGELWTAFPSTNVRRLSSLPDSLLFAGPIREPMEPTHAD